MSENEPEPKIREGDSMAAALLRRWLSERRDTISERPPEPQDEEEVCGVMERGLDLFGDDEEAILAETRGEGEKAELDAAAALERARGFLAPEGGCRLTPEAFGARLQRQPPAQLELPDGVELTGASLAAFLESAHFPFGQYRVGEERFFVTPSLRLGAATLEALARSGRGERCVGRELLVWQPASFRVAAGTAADAREARPFVGPSGARAYLWLGPVLPGGPLVIRDANGVETRITVPESGIQAGSTRFAGTRSGVQEPAGSKSGPSLSTAERPNARTLEHLETRPPEHLTPHPALRRAEEALRRGEERGIVERWLREVMRRPGASGEALAGAGRLWQALGRPELASAAFTMALERGSVEGALGLSRLAEAMGEGLEAAARPLDAAIARNLRSAELHARYAELLGRLSPGWDRGPLVEWHRHRAEELEPGMGDTQE